MDQYNPNFGRLLKMWEIKNSKSFSISPMNIQIKVYLILTGFFIVCPAWFWAFVYYRNLKKSKTSPQTLLAELENEFSSYKFHQLIDRSEKLMRTWIDAQRLRINNSIWWAWISSTYGDHAQVESEVIAGLSNSAHCCEGEDIHHPCLSSQIWSTNEVFPLSFWPLSLAFDFSIIEIE